MLTPITFLDSIFLKLVTYHIQKTSNQEKLLVSTLVTKEVNVYMLDKKTIPYSGLVITQKFKDIGLEIAKEVLESEKFLKHIENTAVSANGVTKRISSKDIENFCIEV